MDYVHDVIFITCMQENIRLPIYTYQWANVLLDPPLNIRLFTKVKCNESLQHWPLIGIQDDSNLALALHFAVNDLEREKTDYNAQHL